MEPPIFNDQNHLRISAELIFVGQTVKKYMYNLTNVYIKSCLINSIREIYASKSDLDAQKKEKSWLEHL